MYHIVYQTTNIVNNKIYIGVRSTADLDDGYLGSGRALKQAVKKYGKDKFVRKILHFCESRKEAYDKEKEIVDDGFINRKDTYNLDLGGNGYFVPQKHSPETITKMKGKKFTEKHRKNLGKASRKWTRTLETREKMSESAKKRGIPPDQLAKMAIGRKGRKHSPETIKLMQFVKNNPEVECPVCHEKMPFKILKDHIRFQHPEVPSALAKDNKHLIRILGWESKLG